MKVAGEATVGAPAETVWAALHDRAVLVRAVPGCEQLEITGPGTGRFVVTTELTAISGTYSGQLTASGQEEPSSLTLIASASGDQGTVDADVTIKLTPAEGGATLVSYEANGVADGAIAGVGARLLASAARRLADEFLAGLDEEVAVLAREHELADQHHARHRRPASLHRPAARSPQPEPTPDSPTAEIPPASSSTQAANRLDAKTGALVAAILAAIMIGVLFGRRSRLAHSARS